MSGLEAIVAALEEAAVVGVASHVNPDGDSVGALLALAMTLRDLGKRVCASLPEPRKYPPQYLFLPGRELLCAPEDLGAEADVFVALDCSNPERLGALWDWARRSRVTLNIDHHEDNMLYAAVNLVDDRASSTSELVFRVIRAAAWPLGPEVATCLYTGVVTDTGRFQHRNTSPETFALAAELAGAGADIFAVAEAVYEDRSLPYTRLLGRTLERIEFVEEFGLAYSYITQEDLAETGAALPETEDLIDHLRAVRGTRLVALFKELAEGGVRVSLRSRAAFEVGPIARAMGGGGHAMAAGYTSERDIEGSIAGLLEALRDRRG